MNRSISFSVFFFLTSCLGAEYFLADETSVNAPTALEIMTRVADRELGEDSIAQMELFIRSGKRKLRERVLKSFSQKMDGGRRNLMVVTAPQNLYNTAFLSLDYKRDQPTDDQWLYLSALERTKRISVKDKSGRFLNSDFSFYDLTLLNTEKFDYELIEETTLEGTPVWKIKATALSPEVAKETGYQESILWVRSDPYLVIKASHQTDNPKRNKEYKVIDYEQIDGIWVVTESRMQVFYKDELEQETTLKVNDVQFNQNLDDALFTVRTLEKGL